MRVFQVIALCWIAVPCVPSVAAWLKLRRLHQQGIYAPQEVKLLLLLTNASYLWILLALFYRTALLGPDYSSQRYSTIAGNLAAMVVVTLWVLVRGRKFRWPPFFAALSTGSVWVYVEIAHIPF